MRIKITGYNIICNLGDNKDEVFALALCGDNSKFVETTDIIKSKKVRIGKINTELPSIQNPDYDIRCNQILLKCFEGVEIEGLIKKYGKNRIGVVGATTNTGVQEFEYSNNIKHSLIGNPSLFVKDYFDLKNYHTTVSTACSSGIKAFSIAYNLLKSNFSDAVVVFGCDGISKVPIFGFDSLEILSDMPSIPFSKNRCGMNIGEGAGVFILEKDVDFGVEILGLGETTDCYHATTPDPEGKDAVCAINNALKMAKLNSFDIDYINLHGTGTGANDLMEGYAVNKIFKDKVLSSSTKPLTGHCLGAAASVEIGLCLKLIEEGHNKETEVFPHIYDGEYDENVPKIKLAKKGDKIKVKNVLCTSFGFGGTNAAIILGGNQ